jgi:hypothetical protein
MVLHKWLRPLAVAPWLTVLALGLTAQDAPKPADSTPVAKSAVASPVEEATPAGVVRVAEHQSKWAYPKEIKVPEGQRLHIVQKGDTLSGLAAHYLGNARAWPQIWELNQWVKDSHWIYPGDPLLVDGSKKPIGAVDKGDGTSEVQDVAPGTPNTASTRETPDLSAPQDVAQLPPDRRRIASKQRDEMGFGFQDFIQMPYLAPKGSDALFRELGALSITGAKSLERSNFGDGEIVYLNGGQDKGLKAGDRFVILKVRAKKLFHPTDPQHRRPLGDVVQQIGVLRVMTVLPNGSVAILEHTMDGVQIGDHVAPFKEPATIPFKLRTDITDPMPIKDLGVVIYARDSHGITAQGELVIIDKGSSDGLQVGDVMIALRRRTFPVTEARDPRDAVMEKTNYVVGQMLVVKTSETTATCRIVRSSHEITIGDLVTR